MTDNPRKNEPRTRGKPFEPGNPGRPKGARHKTTLLAEKLMQEDAEKIVKAVLDAAEKGDISAARIVLDRIAPARRDNPVSFDLPKIESASDAAKVMSAILHAVAAGDVTPMEASEVTRLVDAFVKSLEASEFEMRLARLEQNLARRGEAMNKVIQLRIKKLEDAAGTPSDLANLSDEELAATIDVASNGRLTTPEGFEQVLEEFKSRGWTNAVAVLIAMANG